MSQFRRLSSQRGMSLIGLVVVAVVVGFFMLMGARVFPAINEYLTIRHAVSQIMKNGPASPSDVRSAFEKTTEVEYSIHSIGAKDLDVVQVGDRLRTSFRYNVEIPIVEPVFLLIKFEGSATSGASGP
jgi:type II secretory pathway pseudopilin PulG